MADPRRPIDDRGAPWRPAAREPREHCVPIATVHWRDGRPRVDLRPRRMLVSTDALLELVHGLVRRVEALERRR